MEDEMCGVFLGCLRRYENSSSSALSSSSFYPPWSLCGCGCGCDWLDGSQDWKLKEEEHSIRIFNFHRVSYFVFLFHLSKLWPRLLPISFLIGIVDCMQWTSSEIYSLRQLFPSARLPIWERIIIILVITFLSLQRMATKWSANRTHLSALHSVGRRTSALCGSHLISGIEHWHPSPQSVSPFGVRKQIGRRRKTSSRWQSEFLAINAKSSLQSLIDHSRALNSLSHSVTHSLTY